MASLIASTSFCPERSERLIPRANRPREHNREETHRCDACGDTQTSQKIEWTQSLNKDGIETRL